MNKDAERYARNIARAFMAHAEEASRAFANHEIRAEAGARLMRAIDDYREWFVARYGNDETLDSMPHSTPDERLQDRGDSSLPTAVGNQSLGALVESRFVLYVTDLQSAAKYLGMNDRHATLDQASVISALYDKEGWDPQSMNHPWLTVVEDRTNISSTLVRRS